jgi:hypothetical protein
MSRAWIVVACLDHIRIGMAGGFVQACHGNAAPLRRLSRGDRVACYAPSTEFGGGDRLGAFAAIGVARGGAPYRADMGPGFRPFRCDIDWLTAPLAPIAPLLDRLSFTAGTRNWGYRFRRGFFAISDDDMDVIADAMGVDPLSPQRFGREAQSIGETLAI